MFLEIIWINQIKYFYGGNIMKTLFLFFFVITTFMLFGQSVSDYEYEIIGTGNLRIVKITQYNGSLRSIQIPEKITGIPVTTIGFNAFYNKGLTNVVFPSTILTIEDGAFSRNDIERVLLPKNLKEIGKGSFGFNRLIEIFIPLEVIFIGTGAFMANPLQRIIIGQNTTLEESVLQITGFPDIWTQFTAHYNSSGKQSGIYSTR
jgi:hypothetical protein